MKKFEIIKVSIERSRPITKATHNFLCFYSVTYNQDFTIDIPLKLKQIPADLVVETLLLRGVVCDSYSELGKELIIFSKDSKLIQRGATTYWELVGYLDKNYYWVGNGDMYNITKTEEMPIWGFHSQSEACALRNVPDNAFSIVKLLTLQKL